MGELVPPSDLPQSFQAQQTKLVPKEDLPQAAPAISSQATNQPSGLIDWLRQRARDRAAAELANRNNPQPPGGDLLGQTAAVARGAAGGILGLPGDIEWLGHNFGGVFAPTAMSDYLKTRKQVLPTTEDILRKFPGKSLGESYPIATTVGEFAGGGLAPGLAVKGAKAIPAVGERLLPGAASRAQSAVTKVFPSLGQGVPVPRDLSTMGSYMRDALKGRLEKLWNARSGDTLAARAKFLAKDHMASSVLLRYQNYINNELANARDLSSTEQALLQNSSAELAGNRSLVAIDKEIRRLKDIERKGEMTGGIAIPKQRAKDMADNLIEFTSQYVPEYKELRETYRDRSRLINLFQETTQGRKATEEMSDLLPHDVFKIDPAAIPSSFFKSRETVRRLGELSGDKDFVEASARMYAGMQLEQVTRAAMEAEGTGILSGRKAMRVDKAARDWYNKSGVNSDPPRIWLEESPGAKKAVEAYLDRLSSTADTQKIAAYTASGAAIALLLEEGSRPFYWIRHFLGLH